jgi:hypothetical protein
MKDIETYNIIDTGVRSSHKRNHTNQENAQIDKTQHDVLRL